MFLIDKQPKEKLQLISKIKQFYVKLKQELCFSEEMKNIFLQSFVILLFVFLSIFWKWFSVVALISTLIAIIVNLNGKNLYFVFLLLPFVSIFKININDFYLLPIVVAMIILILGIKLLINLFKKQEKLNIPLTIMMGLFLVYLIIGLKFSNITTFLSLTLGLALLYVIYYFRKDISLKELAFVFGLGILASIVIGLFRPINSRLQLMVAQFSALGLNRFSACAENVNVFAGELAILLSAFACLFMKKQINISFYIIYTITFFVLSFTMSKSALLIFLVLTASLILYTIINEKKKCYKDILIIISCLLIVFIINPIRTYTFMFRLFENDITSSNGLTNLTTGRFDIWMVYLDYIFASFKTIMFGYGISAPNVGAWTSLENCSSHNTIIQMWYHIGIVGIILFFCLLCTYIGWKKVFKLNFATIVIIFAVIMFLMGLDFFSYRFSNYFLFICFAYQKKDEEFLNDLKVDSIENKRRLNDT